MIHLHVHSHYSLLTATPSVTGLVARAVTDGLPALALTDDNALYAAVAFCQACADAGIQPLMGMRLHVAPPPDLHLPAPGQTGPEPLLLLARNPQGWASLCRLSSALQNHPDRIHRLAQGLAWPELPDLLGRDPGLLCLVGGRASWLHRLLRQGEEAKAYRLAGKVGGLFGEGVTYLAQELHTPDDVPVAQAVASIGQRLGLPTVAVQPIYSLDPAERPILRLLAAMDRNIPLTRLPPDALPDQGDEAVALHWLSPQEMAERFADFPDALARTDEIPRRCQPCLPDGRPIWPAVTGEEPPDVALARQAQAGLVQRYGPDHPQAQARLTHELAAIAHHGFAPLFLLVAELVAFARGEGIPVSTRGSVANSLAAFCLGITDVDPVAHDLLFERFLNPARTELPDIDLDFCSRRRDEVLAYARQRFGPERVALVATVNTLQPKSALGEVAKAYGLDPERVKALTRQVQRGWHPDPRRRRGTGVDDLLASLTDEGERTVAAQALALIGLPHHLSIHPGGLVITPGPLTDHVPVQHSPKGFAITQLDHGHVEALGLVKVDLLGIRALSVLAEAVRLVRQGRDPDLRLESIPAQDPATGDLLSRGQTVGVFQCESAGSQRTLRQLRARDAGDLAVANAFFKPGPATGGMADAFVRRYRGEEAASFLHPSLEPILARTQGVLLFQEQILRVATEVAGLSWAEADHLRRGMSKFQPDEMTQLAERFMAGCQRPGGPGLSQAQAETLWHQVAAFAGYGFNQGHATAYAGVSYRSAYLKAHHPAQFLTARLREAGGFHHPAIYIAEARRLGIPVHPPHVNVSERQVTLAGSRQQAAGGVASLQQAADSRRQAAGGEDDDSAIYLGLGWVKGVGKAAARQIVAARQAGGPFVDEGDFLARAGVGKKEAVHLIQAGGLDGLGESRAALLKEAESLGRAAAAGQLAFDFGAESVEPETPSQRLAWELALLGMPVSLHPLRAAPPAEGGADLLPLAQVAAHPQRRVQVAAVRLPGWTGDRGDFLSDESGYLIAHLPDGHRPPPWQPLRLTGHWQPDAWGGGVFVVEGV